jgi:hypothetical protein
MSLSKSGARNPTVLFSSKLNTQTKAIVVQEVVKGQLKAGSRRLKVCPKISEQIEEIFGNPSTNN